MLKEDDEVFSWSLGYLLRTTFITTTCSVSSQWSCWEEPLGPLTLRAPALRMQAVGAAWGRGRRSRRGARPPAAWAGGAAGPPGEPRQTAHSASPAGRRTSDPASTKTGQSLVTHTERWFKRICVRTSSDLVTVCMEPLERDLFL